MFFKDKYFFLSNFYPCTISCIINNKELKFSTVEAAFQAHKNVELADKFVLLTAYEAKSYGKRIPLTTENWDINRLYVMGQLLHIKFCDLNLLKQLKEITSDIYEDNYWGDTFWGRCKGKGKNMLGRLLMNIRDNNNDLNNLLTFITETLIYDIN